MSVFLWSEIKQPAWFPVILLNVDPVSWSFSHCGFRFSTDEGQCWQTYVFSREPIYFTGLASEPGARSMNISIWGFTESFLTRQWVSYTIDFKDILERNCECLLCPLLPETCEPVFLNNQISLISSGWSKAVMSMKEDWRMFHMGEQAVERYLKSTSLWISSVQEK